MVREDQVMTRVGLLFPGAMGARVGAAVGGEVLWTSGGRSEATRRRAEAAGFRDVGSVAALVAESDVVLSICPPAIAEEVAAEVVAAGFEGLYVEANAISPTRVERIAETLRCLDGSILGRKSTLYLSGNAADVAQIAGLFEDSDMPVVALEGGVGAASALKMAYGGWAKISIALAAQACAIARAYGVEDALVREGVESDQILQAGPKAWRWAPEMEEIAATCKALGLPAGIPRGAADLYSRWDAHRDRPAALEQLLDDLSVER